MKIANGKISILINDDYTRISIEDADASTTFCEVKLTPQQLSMALSRLVSTPCEVEVRGLDRIGKKMEWKSMEFEVPKGVNKYHNMPVLLELAEKALPEGWVGEYGFNSQNSFFQRDGKDFARCTIRRWV